MNRLIIIGASGHGKVVADIAKKNGYKDIVFLDNDLSIKECAGFPVLGADAMVAALDGDVFIAIGNAEVRKKLMERNIERNFPVLIHPNAVVADDVEIGCGTVIMAGTVINPGVRIGSGVIINTSSSVDHDCLIGDYCHISVGARLCGTVKVEDSTWIGAGATVSNNINICGDCTIGVGAVIIKDIYEMGTYIGIPARMKK
ncbi:MAG: acetyltransferase [Lachnospiraceae bacterium]|jgi:sugar O-acyltransferase (sialic acid O-acetyltransferase NeuD family)|nr:acetyltransferase [Lachnospiraceae bacterium]